MEFLKSYNRFVKIIIAIVALTFVGWCGYAWTSCDNGIVDYKALRDKAAIKKMFHDDWQLLYYGDFDKIQETDFNVDFMLDNRSSSQHVTHSNLILKVLRESGQTV